MLQSFFKQKIILLVFTSLLFISCNSSEGETLDLITPSNLTISAEIVGKNSANPNGDGSGEVIFTVKATNATSYKIALGEGAILDAKEGANSVTYTNSGTNNYVVHATAYNGLQFKTTSIKMSLYVAPKAIWSDEFNVKGAPNATKWGYDIGAGGWGNNESQYYTNRAENAYVENGVLKIIVKKEDYQGSNYTSARLISKGKFSTKYGKIEFKAKLPTGGGTWPALWMLGDNIDQVNWPTCGEIDIMEHVGNQQNKIFSTLHYLGRSGGNADSTSKVIANASTEFHIYSVDWRADEIKFYVDNVLFKTFKNSSDLPFNQKFFLIMNCAIGGSFGGAIDPKFTASTFEIDYVRVYN